MLYYFVATTAKLVYLLRSFGRLFWGEQPPFTPLGCGGRYLFGDKKKPPNARLNAQRPTPNGEISNPSSLKGLARSEIALPSLGRAIVITRFDCRK